MSAIRSWPRAARALALLSLAPAALALSGCVTKYEPDVIPWSEPGKDDDGDGYTPAEGDCDDYDETIHPDAEELCDGIDNNCDEIIDEDAVDMTTWYIDFDADTFGATSPYDEVSCEQPEGYVADGSDCDDDDPLVNPKADEVCDGVDNNCDELIDEDAEDDSVLWYIDADNDGWGSEDYTIKQCTQPEGYVLELGDCDDLNAEINPDAVEVCNELDDNCNEAIDEDVVETFYLDIDGDGYGVEGDSEVIEGCEAPAGYTTSDGTFDCDDGDPWVYPDAAELCDGVDNDCDKESTEDGTVTWFTEDSATDLSDELGGGTASVGVEYALDDDGELRFCDGTFYVNLTVDGAAVAINGRNGADATSLDGAGTGAVITVQSGADLSLNGVTVLHGEDDQGGGLYISYANAVVTDAIITENSADDDGGGIYVSGATLDMTNTEISQNIASNNGGGMYIYGGSEVTLDDLLILANTAGGDGGGMYAYALSAIEMEDSTITSNTAGEDGGGLVAGYSTTLDFDGVSVSENDATADGGGLYLFGYAALTAVDSGISGNGAAGYGGGLMLFDAEAELSETNLSANDALEGGGAYLDTAGALEVTDCYVAENGPDDIASVGGTTYDYGGTSTFECDDQGCE